MTHHTLRGVRRAQLYPREPHRVVRTPAEISARTVVVRPARPEELIEIVAPTALWRVVGGALVVVSACAVVGALVGLAALAGVL